MNSAIPMSVWIWKSRDAAPIAWMSGWKMNSDRNDVHGLVVLRRRHEDGAGGSASIDEDHHADEGRDACNRPEAEGCEVVHLLGHSERVGPCPVSYTHLTLPTS